MTENTQRAEADAELRRQAEIVLEKLGLDMDTAIRIFLKRVVATRSIPFMLKLEPGE